MHFRKMNEKNLFGVKCTLFIFLLTQRSIYFKQWYEQQHFDIQKIVHHLIETKRFEFVNGMHNSFIHNTT